MFSTSESRWGVAGMATGKKAILSKHHGNVDSRRDSKVVDEPYLFFAGLGQLSQSSVSMTGFGQSLGQLNQSSGLSPALPISTASTVYQAHYGLNSLGKV